jgi:hypothetical protein
MHPELKWFFILLGVLWLAWFFSGGPARVQTNRQNPFIEESSIDKVGEIYSLEELKDRTRP